MNNLTGVIQILQSGPIGGNQGAACHPKHSGLIIIKSPPVWGALAVIGLSDRAFAPLCNNMRARS